MTISFAYFG